ncbi:MAG TPA: DUF2177 family protein [Asticcacaulis sp.]|nr:DUF2177 family protein [Asticcacaulis sp.]
MKAFVIAYGLCLVLMGAFDFVWLSTTTERLYRPAMHGLLRTGFLPGPAIAFYLLYVFALVWLVLKPFLSGTETWPKAIPALTVRAALFALAAFGTYDLTGLAVIRDWPVSLSLIDMAWGTVNGVLTANLAAFALKATGQIK